MDYSWRHGMIGMWGRYLGWYDAMIFIGVIGFIKKTLVLFGWSGWKRHPWWKTYIYIDYITLPYIHYTHTHYLHYITLHYIHTWIHPSIRPCIHTYIATYVINILLWYLYLYLYLYISISIYLYLYLYISISIYLIYLHIYIIHNMILICYSHPLLRPEATVHGKDMRLVKVSCGFFREDPPVFQRGWGAAWDMGWRAMKILGGTWNMRDFSTICSWIFSVFDGNENGIRMDLIGISTHLCGSVWIMRVSAPTRKGHRIETQRRYSVNTPIQLSGWCILWWFLGCLGVMVHKNGDFNGFS